MRRDVLAGTAPTADVILIAALDLHGPMRNLHTAA
jgi:hypothetical protein